MVKCIYHYCTADIKQEAFDNELYQVKEEKISPWEAETGYMTIKPEPQTHSVTSGGDGKTDMVECVNMCSCVVVTC